MTERTTENLVTFRHPFMLRAMDELQPPGTCRIEIVEEQIDTLSFVANRRVSTTINLPAVGTASLHRQVVAIAPEELEAALKQDASATTMDSGALPD